MVDEQASGRRRSFSMPSVDANSAKLRTIEPTSVGLRPLMSSTSHTVSVSVFLAYLRGPSESCRPRRAVSRLHCLFERAAARRGGPPRLVQRDGEGDGLTEVIFEVETLARRARRRVIGAEHRLGQAGALRARATGRRVSVRVAGRGNTPSAARGRSRAWRGRSRTAQLARTGTWARAAAAADCGAAQRTHLAAAVPANTQALELGGGRPRRQRGDAQRHLELLFCALALELVRQARKHGAAPPPAGPGLPARARREDARANAAGATGVSSFRLFACWPTVTFGTALRLRRPSAPAPRAARVPPRRAASRAAPAPPAQTQRFRRAPRVPAQTPPWLPAPHRRCPASPRPATRK